MVEVKEIVELNRNIVVSLATLRKNAIITFSFQNSVGFLVLMKLAVLEIQVVTHDNHDTYP